MKKKLSNQALHFFCILHKLIVVSGHLNLLLTESVKKRQVKFLTLNSCKLTTTFKYNGVVIVTVFCITNSDIVLMQKTQVFVSISLQDLSSQSEL